MDLRMHKVPDWPKLAWVARMRPGGAAVEALHGPYVERRRDWCVEAVWAGRFEEGDFDRTDLVFGTGVRLRDGVVRFVNAGTGVDRLWHVAHEGGYAVSNSLPALLAVTGLALREDYTGYSDDIQSVEVRGIRHYVREIPSSGPPLGVLYFDDLVYDGRTLVAAEKPSVAPPFPTFAAYEAFLIETAHALGENSRARDRRWPVTGIVGVSSGYDSPAVAVVARHAGCTRAVTIHQSRSLWRGPDSGEPVARALGLPCAVYDHSPRNYRLEHAVWAATGLAGGLNLTLFDYPEPLAMFYSGSYGDKVWDRRPHDLSEPVGDRDHLLGEFRLIQGLFQCVVPWWGIHRAGEINALGAREEMAPWTLGNSYDRPVARRLAEEAGIPRKAFGIRKKDTSSNVSFLWPRTREAQARFARWLRDRGLEAPSRARVGLFRKLAKLEGLIYYNLPAKLRPKRRLRPWLRLAGTRRLFQWGNEELKAVYAAGLDAFRREASP